MQLPPALETAIEKVLNKRFKVSLQDHVVLAQAVHTLSDHYTDDKGIITTPWEKPACQMAYLAYYLPLNYLRNQSVVQEAGRVGFLKAHRPEHVLDFGAGLGAASLALGLEFQKFPWSLEDIEKSPQALGLLTELRQELSIEGLHSNVSVRPKAATDQKTLGLFSYSLTELEKPPAFLFDCEALIILEPSTRSQSRKLLQLRAELIEKGFSIWAPCTHQGACPMLSTAHDFCHDRVHFQAPEWFTKIEAHLPMKNRTLTFSYLLAGRQAPPDFSNLARLVGDSLEEKGKTRQLVCFDSERKFLTWMHRDDQMQTLPRGRLIFKPTEFELKSNEMRLKRSIISCPT
jgi:ribosomal protein RSM22 (predicted rRNA methylase)